MVHTATLSCIVNKDVYMRYLTLDGNRFYPDSKHTVNYSFKSLGVKLRGYKIEKPNYTGYRILMTVNFKRLIEQDNHVLVYKESDYDLVKKQFNVVIDKIGIGLKYFDEWKVMRIDYCFNCYTEHVKEYIRLLQKGDKYNHHRVPYNKQRNYSRYKGSCYYVGKSTTINFYDKQDQLIKESLTNPDITDKMIQDAKNILRLEVQCKKPSTEYIKQRHNKSADLYDHWYSKHLDYYLSYDIAVYELHRVIKELRSIQDYTTKRNALKLIKNSDYQNKTKESLKDIIEHVAKQHSSIWKARMYFNDAGTDNNEFRRHLKRIEDLGINVVTLPRDSHLKSLPAVYDLLEQSYDLERSFDYEITDDMNYLNTNDIENIENY